MAQHPVNRKPTVNTGFSEVIGSWKIIEMSAPRSRRSWVIQPEQVNASVHDPLPGRTVAFSLGRGRGSKAEVTGLFAA
jgi:hypothetical protein